VQIGGYSHACRPWQSSICIPLPGYERL
jgi:hypothetical protein